MPNIRTKCRQSRLKAFTLLESLLTLALVSFLILSLSARVEEVFRQTEQTIFFMSFEHLYTDSQRLAVSTRQGLKLTLQEDEISNGYQKLTIPKSIQLIQPMQLTFQSNGGNSSLAKVQFQTPDGPLYYQLYLGSGRYQKTTP